MLLTLHRIYYTPGIFVKCTSLNNAVIITLGSTYNEHLATTSRFLYIKIIDCNVKKFGYGSFTLADPDSDSDSDSKPHGYIVLFRTFHIGSDLDPDPFPLVFV